MKGACLSRGFTIFEVLLALALMALVAGIFAVNFDVLLRGIGVRNPQTLFANAVREARYQASTQHDEVFLSYSSEEQRFEVTRGEGSVLKAVETPSLFKLKFKQVPAEVLSGGVFRKEGGELEVLEALSFHPDGSSSPVVVELASEDGDFEVRLDPFSTNLLKLGDLRG